ncbi:peptidoglycan DD-metalloendopeptidase family protein [uncultured Cyclobacterium sp.]|uniref:peptidoglycan DD-metalloendopeptidase family protein n=1 Tax=uncultured Cyclobacterium sp. TaxID=453820 RepID=UPI0030EF5845
MKNRSLLSILVVLVGWFACINEDVGTLTPAVVTIPEQVLEIDELASLTLINASSNQNPSFVTNELFSQDNSLSFTQQLFGVSELYYQGIQIQLKQKLPENDRTEFEMNIPDSFISELAAEQRIVLFAKIYQDAGNEILDFYYPIPSTVNLTSKTLSSMLPQWVFTNKRGNSTTFEARLLVAIVDATKESENSFNSRMASGECESEPICCPLGGDLCASSRVISDFQSPIIENGIPKIHTGVDYAVPIGHPIIAVNEGFVLEAGEIPGYGKAVAIRHSNGTTSLYAFLSEIIVSKGETVRRGELIGESGSRSSSNESHLHFEYIKTGNPFSGGSGQEPVYMNPAPCLNNECGKAASELDFLLEGATEVDLAGKEAEKLSNALRVKLSENGQPVGGKKIEWKVAEGDGSVQDIQNFTSSEGFSTASYTMGAEEKQVVSASFQDQTVTFEIRKKVGILKMHDGDNQSGGTNMQSTDPLVVQLTENNNPFAGEIINWTIVEGDGSLPNESSETNQEGLAEVHYVFGSEGESVIRASYEDQSVDFTLTAVANKLSIVSGNDQKGLDGRKLNQPLTVKVANFQDEAIEGATISWSLERGDGVLVDMVTSTDKSGLASANLVMGKNDTQVVRATYGNQTAEFVITKGSIKLVIVSGNNQKAIANREIPEPLIVKLTDQDDESISGENINWGRASGDGSVINTQTTTDENGKSQTSYLMGAQATQVVRATYENINVDFTISRNQLKLEIVSGNDQTADVGIKLNNDLVARLLDSDNNPVPNEEVRWERKNGNGQLEIVSSTTDEEGKVSASYTVGSDYLHVVSVTYPGTNLQVNFQINRTRKILKIFSGDNQKVLIGESVKPLIIRLEDMDGRPISGETIIWERIQGDGVLTPISETTNLAGSASANYVMGEAKVHQIRVKFEEQEVIFNLEREYIAPKISFYEVSIVPSSELVPSYNSGTHIIFSFFYEDKDGDLLSTDQLGVKRLYYNVYCTSGCEDNFQGRVRWGGGTIPINDPRGAINFHNGDDYSGSFGLSVCGLGNNTPLSMCKSQVWEVTISDRAGNESNVAVADWDWSR